MHLTLHIGVQDIKSLLLEPSGIANRTQEGPGLTSCTLVVAGESSFAQLVRRYGWEGARQVNTDAPTCTTIT